MPRQHVSPRAMMEAAGHSSATLTLDVYTHTSVADRERVAEAIERAYASL